MKEGIDTKIDMKCSEFAQTMTVKHHVYDVLFLCTHVSLQSVCVHTQSVEDVCVTHLQRRSLRTPRREHME